MIPPAIKHGLLENPPFIAFIDDFPIKTSISVISQFAMFEDTRGYLAQSSLPRLVDTEIAILKVLNHPHVLQLYEVYFEPSTTAPRWLNHVSTFGCETSRNPGLVEDLIWGHRLGHSNCGIAWRGWGQMSQWQIRFCRLSVGKVCWYTLAMFNLKNLVGKAV